MEISGKPLNGYIAKCNHCGGGIIAGDYYRITHDQSGRKHFYHSDSILGKDCVAAAGIDYRMTEYPPHH